MEYLFSCEHATCTVPHAFRELFRGAEELVTSPAGWEPGALNLAQGFAMRFRTPLVHSEVTRLLVDVEQDGDARWSSHSASLADASRAKLNERYRATYHQQLETRIRAGLDRYGRVLHVMVHTDADRDGRIVLETIDGMAVSRDYARAWVELIERKDLRAKHQHPEQPVPLAHDLAQRYSAAGYSQIRLRVSQSFFLEGKPWGWATLKKFLLDSLMLLASRHPELISDPASPSTVRR